MDKLKSALNYGVLLGLIAFTLFVLYYLFDANPLGNISWISAIIPVVGIPLAIKRIRDKEWGGFISFGEAFRQGMVVSLVWATLFAMLSYIFYAVVDSTILENHIVEVYENTEKGMEAISAFVSDEDAKEEAMKEIRAALEEIKNMTMADVVIGDITNKLIGGLIIALIAAGILKKKKPLEDIQEA